MKRRISGPALFCLLALGCAAAPGQKPAADRTATLEAGDTAPDFTLPDQDGNQVSLADFRGKRKVVLAFYIKAFTGG